MVIHTNACTFQYLYQALSGPEYCVTRYSTDDTATAHRCFSGSNFLEEYDSGHRKCRSGCANKTYLVSSFGRDTIQTRKITPPPHTHLGRISDPVFPQHIPGGGTHNKTGGARNILPRGVHRRIIGGRAQYALPVVEKPRFRTHPRGWMPCLTIQCDGVVRVH